MRIKTFAFAIVAVSSLGLLHAESLTKMTCTEYDVNNDRIGSLEVNVHDFGKIAGCPVTISVNRDENYKDIYMLKISYRLCHYKTDYHTTMVCNPKD